MKRNSIAEWDRREKRRKRKQRNQAIAYGVLLLLVAALCMLAVSGARYVVQQKEQQSQQQESWQGSNQESQQEGSQESKQEAVENLFASEESIQAPEVSEETEESTESQLTPEERLEQIIEEQIAGMTLEEKVAGLFFVTPEAITGVSTAVKAGDGTRTALEKYAVGGLIYFKKNIQTKEQITEMIHNSQSFSKYPLFIGVDEEGGSVNRVAAVGLAQPRQSAAEIGATGDPDNAYKAGEAIGTYLSELGFNVDFAPVADIANVSNSVMKSRSYGEDAETVAPFMTAMMTGLHDSGITGCLKHFPGIGSTTADTHNGLASTQRSGEEFRSQELQVFKAGIDSGARMIMVGHVNVPALDPENHPASMSKAVITDILRNELGYEGVIITDALNMSAISEYYSAEQAAIMALKAGCDMLLMPEDFLQAYAGVVTAVAEGTISRQRVEDSLRRIYRIKYAEEAVSIVE